MITVKGMIMKTIKLILAGVIGLGVILATWEVILIALGGLCAAFLAAWMCALLLRA